MKLTKFDTLPGKTPLEKLTWWSAGQTIYCQYKYNGLNARYYPATGRMVTRDNKYWDMGRFPTAFIKELTDFSGADVLYGELVYSGESLQSIAGLLSVNGLKPIPDDGLRFMIYDIRQPDQPWIEQPFSQRVEWMEDRDYLNNFVRSCKTVCQLVGSADTFYTTALAEHFEGCVYRIDPCYDSGPEDSPNPHAVKRKALHEAEGICVGFTEGTGKRKGMLGCLIVELPNGVRLSVGGGKGLTDEQLKNLYNNPPYGLPVTYSYEELSTNGTPLRPQLVAVRNYE